MKQIKILMLEKLIKVKCNSLVILFSFFFFLEILAQEKSPGMQKLDSICSNEGYSMLITSNDTLYSCVIGREKIIGWESTSGIYYEYYKPNELRLKVGICNGKFCGAYSYFLNNKLISDGIYVNGRKVFFTLYKYDENGELVSQEFNNNPVQK